MQDQIASQPGSNPAAKSYQSPTLTRLGKVEQLTQSGTLVGPETFSTGAAS